ncbi:MAG: HslU--HslV peptidase ATPase subunit, partial [Proteobacteria bacterium]
TGVGKIEISRRLAKLAKAPFVKVEASKFTEVGYVGRDVDSIIRDLTDISHNMLREEERQRVREKAEKVAEEQLLDLLLPGSRPETGAGSAVDSSDTVILQDQDGIGRVASVSPQSGTREKLREMLLAGKLEDRIVEVETAKHVSTHMQILGPQGFGEIEGQIKEMFANMVPKQREVRKLPIREARKVLQQEAQENLIDHEQVSRLAVKRAEQSGIVFIDEIDKICGKNGSHGPDVSREGVQRDLLPLVEGCTVNTKYGPLKTDHILFIASGAFHTSKPSDLMPEFQGRFPIRVELASLSPRDFVRILTEPENALTAQYRELLRTEEVELEFTSDGIEEIAALTAEVNSRTENIGARRLHTLLEKLLEEVSFGAAEYRRATVKIDRDYVRSKLQNIVEDKDLSRFIL